MTWTGRLVCGLGILLLASRTAALATKDPVSVMVSADPGLSGGSITVRPEGGQWEERGTYVGFGDMVELENHTRYEIRVEKAQLFSIRWGSLKMVPVKELSSNIVVKIHEEDSTLPNTRNIVLAIMAGVLPLGGIAWYRFRGRQSETPDTVLSSPSLNSKLTSKNQVYLPANLTIGRYRLEELLGEGGMASVYKVKDDIGGFYAMKIPHALACKDANFVRRFEREISIAITFQHPNIIRVHDYGTYAPEDGSVSHIPYFVMELATGTVLDQYLVERARAGVPPDLAFAVQVASAVAEALVAAHARGIVHRDIKPANVIVDGQGRFKVMDFGIAKADNQLTALTTAGVVGTPAYMAPEQVSRARPVDSRADLYALGALLYSMVTYTIPFWDEDVTVMVTQKLTEPAPMASQQNPEIPAGLDAIIARLLERRPDDRLQTATEVVAALAYFQQHPNQIPPTCAWAEGPSGEPNEEMLSDGSQLS